MRDSKYGHFWAGALVALIAVFSMHALDAHSAKRSASQVLLSPEDYIEIQQLYGMYARDVDPGSVRDASWMFTSDAVVNIAGVKPMTTPPHAPIRIDSGSRPERSGRTLRRWLPVGVASVPNRTPG